VAASAVALVLPLVLPATASAHGPVAPLASNYLARVADMPAGVQAEVVDGDQRLWLETSPRLTVVVLDYRGAPYLRFSSAGVEVNQNSEMYYLNQTPVALTPPSNLTAGTPPDWHRATSGHSYEWHDGRLHALAAVALAPGASYVGRWSIPVVVGGVRGAVAGGLWHASPPSVVWFWPILVLVLCVLAARRLRRAELDSRLARLAALAVLLSLAVAACGRQLHGRPAIGAFAVVELVVTLALVSYGLWLVVRGRAGPLSLFVIALAALWEGITLLPTLLDGFVLMALPAFVARAATVLCLGGGAGLLLLAFRIFESSGTGRSRRRQAVGATLLALALAGCGSAAGRVAARESEGLPAALVAQARPIGHGARFQPPARGPALGACRGELGPRFGVHVELFAANRVVLVAAGIGTRAPRRWFDGRISGARCYGELVTLEPTGVVLVRPGGRLRLAELFRSWGQALSGQRLASFTGAVRVFVDGRRRAGLPGAVRLTRHAEIVLEVGPAVPPHSRYTFPPGS
jgi:hypothetical protein